MRASSSVHDLRTLIRSAHPFIVIETVEEERVFALVQSVAAQERMPLFEWSITRGLTRRDDSQTINKLTATPSALLQHLNGLTVEAIFWLKDLAPHLQDAAAARQLREVAAAYGRSRATCLLTGHPIALPPDLEHIAVRLDLHLPDRDELRAMLQTVVQSLSTRASSRRPASTTVVQSLLNSMATSKAADTGPTAQEREAILRALQGLTLHQARQVVTQCIVEDGTLSADDIQTIVKRKVQAIKDGGLLEYYPLEDNRFELGGFGNLKAWLERAKVGFTAEAKALNLTPPRGLMLVGVPGCGKSLAAKAIAREWQLPLRCETDRRRQCGIQRIGDRTGRGCRPLSRIASQAAVDHCAPPRGTDSDRLALRDQERGDSPAPGHGPEPVRQRALSHTASL